MAGLTSILGAAAAHADGMPSDPNSPTGDPATAAKAKSHTAPTAKRDPLKVDPQLSVRSEAAKAVDLPVWGRAG